MFRKLKGSPNRRILTYSAIHPSKTISSHTLLSSLITLAQNICDYKPNFFPSNKKNAHEAIRQIGVLLIFLEEIKENGSDLQKQFALSFLELHLVFQNLLYLLEDCTREGARIWMLLNSDRVASKFRILDRAISTVLELLPLGLLHDVSSDVKEHVELVMRQARKAGFETEADDKRVMNVLQSVLYGFENGILPNEGDVKRVVDYLGIKKWSMCNKEVKFLDSEIVFERSSNETEELTTLNTLMGFMCYCRCVLFDVVDGQAREHSYKKCSNDLPKGLNPDDFRCPIALEIMVDPVTIETGHTYDRSSILKWFKDGKPTCPNTGKKVKNTELVPNLALRNLIQYYCAENGIPFTESGHRDRDISKTIVAGSFVAEKIMKIVSNFLANKLEIGREEQRNKVAYELRLLSKASIFNRSCLVESGVIPHLLFLLLSTDSSTQENSIAAILNLSKHSEGKSAIIENGGLQLLVYILKEGLKLEAKQLAAGTLFYLASVKEYRIMIGENPPAIPALIELIKDGNDRCKKNAMVAIFGLLLHPENHWRVLTAGAIPLLVDILISSDGEYLVIDSLAILATLTENSEGAISVLGCGALDPIIKLLSSSTSSSGKEYCVSLLLSLCINGGTDVVSCLAESPSLMGSLYSQLTEVHLELARRLVLSSRSYMNFMKEEHLAQGLQFFHKIAQFMFGNPKFYMGFFHWLFFYRLCKY